MADYVSSYGHDEVRARLRERTREEQAYREDPVYVRRRKDRRFNLFRDILGITAFLMCLVLAAMFYAHNYTYTTYSLDSEVSLGNLRQAELYSFNGGVVSVGTDSVSFVENGTVRWTETLSFEDPVFSSRGSFFAICDRDSYVFHICDSTGVLASARVSRKIQGIDISSTGVTAVFTENNEASYITYFDRFGNRLSVEIKSVFTATGYPVDISLSPDAQELCVLYYSLQNGIGESRLLLYDFKNGKSADSYIVLKMEDFYDDGTLLMDSVFFDNAHFAVIGDKKIRFVTYTNVRKAEAVSRDVGLSDNVRSVVTSAQHLLVTEDTEDGSLVRIYTVTGELYASFETEASYDTILLNDRYVCVLSGKTVNYYNLSGRHRYTGELVSYPVAAAFCGRSVMINNGEKLQKITFK